MMYSIEPIEQLTANILDHDLLDLRLQNYKISKNPQTGHDEITFTVRDNLTSAIYQSQGVDAQTPEALFNGFIKLYRHLYTSLSTVHMTTLRIASNAKGQEAVLHITGGQGQQLAFAHVDDTAMHAALQVILHSTAFFINCERAFIAAYRALLQARRDKRPDSINLYTQQLATLVCVTSYSDVIDQQTALHL